MPKMMICPEKCQRPIREWHCFKHNKKKTCEDHFHYELYAKVKKCPACIPYKPKPKRKTK